MSDPTSAETAVPTIYQDEDLVYVDPQAKTVVGLVQFDANGKPKKKTQPSAAADTSDADGEQENPAQAEAKKGKGRNRLRTPRTRYCPWGTYRSMKRIFKLEGKPQRAESNKTLDEVLERALREPFWD